MDLKDYFSQQSQSSKARGGQTFNYFNPRQIVEKINFISNEDVVFFGQQVLEEALKKYCPDHKVKWYFNDGDIVLKSQTIALLECPKAQLYQNSHTFLTLIQKLTAQLTLLKCYIEKANSLDIIAFSSAIEPLYSLENSVIKLAGTTSDEAKKHQTVTLDKYILSQFESPKEALNHFKSTYSGTLAFKLNSAKEKELLLGINIDYLIIENSNLAEIKDCLELESKPKKVEVYGAMTLDQLNSLTELGVNVLNISPVLNSVTNANLIFDF